MGPNRSEADLEVRFGGQPAVVGRTRSARRHGPRVAAVPLECRPATLRWDSAARPRPRGDGSGGRGRRGDGSGPAQAELSRPVLAIRAQGGTAAAGALAGAPRALG